MKVTVRVTTVVDREEEVMFVVDIVVGLEGPMKNEKVGHVPTVRSRGTKSTFMNGLYMYFTIHRG